MEREEKRKFSPKDTVRTIRINFDSEYKFQNNGDFKAKIVVFSFLM